MRGSFTSGFPRSTHGWLRPAALRAGTNDRGRLLAQRNGFAESVTGGHAAPRFTHVNSLADSGPGTLREALERPGPAWIVFRVSGRLSLKTPIMVTPDKTVDGRGRNIVITDQGMIFDGRISGRRANLILAYLTFDHAQTDRNDDAIRIEGGGDLGWIHHCTLRDGTDGLIDIVNARSRITRWTIDWCRFGPHPGPKAAAAGLVDGKLALIGRDHDLSGPNAIRVTWHHNYAINCNNRQPRTMGSWIHAYNNVVRYWGRADGRHSAAMEVAEKGQLLAEANIFLPYRNGARHWLRNHGGAATVRVADKDAIKVSRTPGWAKIRDNVLRHGAQAQEHLPNRVFRPSYDYRLDTPNAEMERRVVQQAGNK